MTEKDFAENAKTGDLLLFRGFELPGKCQRFFTQADYGNINYNIYITLHKKITWLFFSRIKILVN